jgi:hypothetical protein
MYITSRNIEIVATPLAFRRFNNIVGSKPVEHQNRLFHSAIALQNVCTITVEGVNSSKKAQNSEQ